MDIDVNLALARVEECWRASHLAESAVRLYMKRLKPMKRIARELGSICVDQALLDAYVEEAIARKGLRSSIVKSRLTVVRWVCRVLDLPPYPTDSAGKPIFAKKEVPEWFADSYQGFLSALKVSGLADATKQEYSGGARSFLVFLDDQVGSLAELELFHIEDYLAFSSQIRTESSLKNTKADVLAFLRYLQQGCDTFDRLVTQVSQLPMKPAQPKLQRILTEDEATAMLQAAERTLVNPKRTLFIVAMLAQYSMRCIDLRNILIEDVNWNEMTIKVGSSKTKDERVFPLTETIKYIILDYLKNERPECDCPYLLVTAHKPPRRLLANSPIETVLQRVAREAGVTLGYRFGAHAFRRTGATTLMASGVDYPSISEHLMHASSAKGLAQTTMRYLSIDIERLRGAALEVRPRAAR